MVTVKQDTQVFFNGGSLVLTKGVQFKKDAALVKAKPELFEGVKQEPKVKKVEAKVEELKEELLIEEPVAALQVEETFEVVTETVEETEEEKPKRRKKK